MVVVHIMSEPGGRLTDAYSFMMKNLVVLPLIIMSKIQNISFDKYMPRIARLELARVCASRAWAVKWVANEVCHSFLSRSAISFVRQRFLKFFLPNPSLPIHAHIHIAQFLPPFS